MEDLEKHSQCSEQIIHEPVTLGFLERYLAIWVFLSMVVGVLIGYFVPNASTALEAGEFCGVSGPMAAALMVMMYPILIDVEFESLPRLFSHRDIWKEIAINLVFNWILSPMIMFGLSWALLPDQPELREGLILVGIARCIAMVLIWVKLAHADSSLGALLLAMNALLQIALYAPVSILFIQVFHGGGSDATASSVSTAEAYKTTAGSVGVFLGIPLGLAALTRVVFRRIRFLPLKRWQNKTPEEVFDIVGKLVMSPMSLIGLLATIIILFVAQGHQVIKRITSVLRVVAPMSLYFPLTFMGTLYFCWKVLPLLGVTFDVARTLENKSNHREDIVADQKLPETIKCRHMSYDRAAMHAFLAASNNFELAIAVAAARYGSDSKQSLATSVGPLVEVPLMLGLVRVAEWYRKRWEDVNKEEQQEELRQQDTLESERTLHEN
ncbi:arsenical-resistance protein [Limtongia smithiae]|uniref:arsenical-resistance protein n=1 Tax=Limtongia smithiae TaxID=1125753 RepID=UPI0034CFE327